MMDAEELVLALKAASEHRDSVVSNISYAHQVSGESVAQYREALEEADKFISFLISEIKKLQDKKRQD